MKRASRGSCAVGGLLLHGVGPTLPRGVPCATSAARVWSSRVLLSTTTNTGRCGPRCMPLCWPVLSTRGSSWRRGSRRAVSFLAANGVVRSTTMPSIAERAQRQRRVILISVASAASLVTGCILANDSLVEMAVSSVGYPPTEALGLEMLSLLLSLHEPNRDVAVEKGILLALNNLSQKSALRGLDILVELCKSERHQDAIAKQFRPTLLNLSQTDDQTVSSKACSALARLACHEKNPILILQKEYVQPLFKLSMLDERVYQNDAACAIYALSPYGSLMDFETRQLLVEATSMLILSPFLETKSLAYRTLARLSQHDYWRPIIAEQGCLYHILLGVNGRLSDNCRKWALKALVFFAYDRNYRQRVGEGGLSSFIKTVIENPYDEVKAPAVQILAILASNDSYRNRILGTTVLDKVVGYLNSTNIKLRIQSAHLLDWLAATDETRKRAADLNAVEAIIALFRNAPNEDARTFSAAAMYKLAQTGSVRQRLGSNGAVEALSAYLRESNSPLPARSFCFAALTELSHNDDLRAKIKSEDMLKIIINSTESSDREESMWALRILHRLCMDEDVRAKLTGLGCRTVLIRINNSRLAVAEVKLLAQEVLGNLR